MITSQHKTSVNKARNYTSGPESRCSNGLRPRPPAQGWVIMPQTIMKN